MCQKTIKHITNSVRENFRSFGGGEATPGNPVAAALKDGRPQFAAGVDIEDVVTFILIEFVAATKSKEEIPCK